MQTLVGALRAQLKAARAEALAGLEPQLEAELLRRYEEARAQHPGIRVSPEQWVEALAARLPPDAPVLEGVAACRAGDLLVVCGCLEGDAAALAGLEVALNDAVASAGSAVRANADALDTARQHLHASLLVGEREPGLARYAARGDLRGFLRIAAVRALLRQRERDQREIGADAELLEALAPAVDPELESLKLKYRDDFAACFREALAGLSPRDRTLLRLNLIEKTSIDGLGRLFGVHRATAARWLERVKGELGARTEEMLGERLGIEAAEVASIIRLVRSQVDVSLQRLLADPASKG
jgi:RNA polymerase sigma-70 factor, ECF subfamily